MAINTRPKDISVHVDPFSFMADIKVLSGNPAQTYNQDTKEYEPDRSLVPCLLMPYVEVSDPEGYMNGSRSITGCEWYEGAPKADRSNRITAETPGYVISDTGTPAYSLKVKKNVGVNSPIELHAIFTIVDTRKNTEVTMERSVALYTALYDTKVFNLRLTNQPASWVIDPLRVTASSKGEWLHTVSAQLYSGKEAVADANAAYWWEIMDIGGGDTSFRAVTSDELDICISGKDVSGNWTKNLTFDARFFRSVAFRCRAAFYSGSRPSSPSSENLQVTTAVKVEMPKTLRADIRQRGGAKVSPSLSTSVSFECVLTDNTQLIPSGKNSLFDITWYASSGKAGVSNKQIGSGRSITFSPSSLGFDKAYPMSVYASVRLYAVTAVVTSGGKVMTQNNAAVVTKKYE